MARGDDSIVGARSELLAAAWLMELGYEVFRNVSPCGPADLVAWKRGTEAKYLIDVKTVNTVYQRADGIDTPNVPAAHPDGVHYLVVSRGQVLGFYKREDGRKGSVAYWPLGPSL